MRPRATMFSGSDLVFEAMYLVLAGWISLELASRSDLEYLKRASTGLIARRSVRATCPIHRWCYRSFIVFSNRKSCESLF